MWQICNKINGHSLKSYSSWTKWKWELFNTFSEKRINSEQDANAKRHAKFIEHFLLKIWLQLGVKRLNTCSCPGIIFLDNKFICHSTIMGHIFPPNLIIFHSHQTEIFGIASGCFNILTAKFKKTANKNALKPANFLKISKN